jgi:hypothetical protein
MDGKVKNLLSVHTTAQHKNAYIKFSKYLLKPLTKLTKTTVALLPAMKGCG